MPELSPGLNSTLSTTGRELQYHTLLMVRASTNLIPMEEFIQFFCSPFLFVSFFSFQLYARPSQMRESGPTTLIDMLVRTEDEWRWPQKKIVRYYLTWRQPLRAQSRDECSTSRQRPPSMAQSQRPRDSRERVQVCMSVCVRPPKSCLHTDMCVGTFCCVHETLASWCTAWTPGSAQSVCLLHPCWPCYPPVNFPIRSCHKLPSQHSRSLPLLLREVCRYPSMAPWPETSLRRSLSRPPRYTPSGPSCY